MNSIATKLRRGATAAIALTLMGVTGLFVGVILHRTVQEQRQLRHRQNEWQAHWLARSALERAQLRVESDPRYQGEEWRPESDGMQPLVDIKVHRPEGTQASAVSVSAIYPATDFPLRVEIQITSDLKPKVKR